MKNEDIISILQYLNVYGKHLVLVGMPGVGKSTTSYIISRILNIKYKDSDQEIERAANLSIKEIFEKFGEDYFRRGEERVIARLLNSKRPMVIATGGGAVISPITRNNLRKYAIVIWIKSPIKKIHRAVLKRNNRPILMGKGKSFLVKLIKEREKYYKESNITVRNDFASQKELSLKILSKVLDYISKSEHKNERLIKNANSESS